MRSVVLVVIDVLIHQALQVPFIQHDHMVEQIPAAVADPSLGNAILPGTSKTNSLRFDPEAVYGIDDFCIEVASSIKDQIFRCGIKGKGLAQLLNDPRARRMPGHVAVKDAPPVMRNNEETVEDAEGERWHDEEIHRCDGFPVIAQESRPSFRRLGTSRRFPHPTQHSSFGNIEAEYLQFTMNTRRAPGRIFGNHAEDEVAQFPAYTFSSRICSVP